MEGKSKLYEAIKNDDLESVKILLQRGFYNDYPLRKAARYGHLEVVKYLLEQGADLHVDNDYPLRKAARYGHLEVVKYLLEQGADLHVDNDYPLRYAAENGHLEVVKYLLEQGADLHAGDNDALRWAALRGHLEIVKYLVEQGADLHAENDWALRLAARNSHLEVVKCLVEKGADSDRLSEEMIVNLFASYDLQVKKITPRLLSLLLKTKFLRKLYKKSTGNKKIFFSLVILMYRLYYRPGGPGFFQAIEQI